MAKTSYDAPAVRKAVSLIEMMCESDKPLGVAEISQNLDINSNMVFRLLKTLEEAGWIVKTTEGPKYSMSLRPFHFMSKTVRRMSLRRAADEPMHRLWDDTHESCYLGIIDGTKTLFLEHLDATGDVRVMATPGGRFLMHCAAPGKVLLAFSPERFIEKVVKIEGLSAQTKNSIRTMKVLQKELMLIRERGYATDNEEYAEGLFCFAAPVFNVKDELAGTIGISVLSLYYSLARLVKELGPKVVFAANTASKSLGATRQVIFKC
jgi:IclR family transcriptional regulator, KDG regulon repressor